MSEYRAKDTDGREWEYRLVSSVLEYRRKISGGWASVDGLNAHWWSSLTPNQLRAIADCMEGVQRCHCWRGKESNDD